MSLVKINWNPTNKELRQFGWIAIIAMSLIATLCYYVKHVELKYCAVIFYIGVVIFIISLISLKLTKYIYVGMSAATFPIGMCISFIVMAIFFYIVITPIGLIFRLFGRDSMKRRFEPEKESYWILHKQNENLRRYFRQF
jgi:hypothetical protein